MDGLGNLHRIAVPAHMHVEGGGARPQQVIVHRRDLDTAFDQLRHDGVDLGLQQHEIAHDHRAAVHRLEGHPAAEREGRLDGDAVKRHLEIGARKAVTMNIAGHRRGPP